MSAQFTPGPWRYSLTDDERHAVVSPPLDAGDAIGPWFTAIVQCADDAVEDANARLIAAAPELFDAAVAAWELISASRAEGKGPTNAEALLRLALSKANGEQVHSDPLPKQVGR